FALLKNSRKPATPAEGADREFLGCTAQRDAAFALLKNSRKTATPAEGCGSRVPRLYGAAGRALRASWVRRQEFQMESLDCYVCNGKCYRHSLQGNFLASTRHSFCTAR